MNRSSVSALLILLLLAVTVRATVALSPDERFKTASTAYVAQDFAEAVSQLREFPLAGQWAHGALHNLGNAEWKVSRPGYAVLAWERARTMNPFDRNTAANLHFARAQAQLPVPKRPWFEQYSEWLPGVAWLAAAAIGLWGGVTLLVLPPLVRVRRADWHQAVAALLLVAFLLAVPALIGLHTRSKMGVVVEEETALRLTPTKDGEALANVAAGEVGRIENLRGDYFYVRAEGDRAGWVHRREFSKIWP